ncbi:hypothetical protein GS489_01130 [Rhodococcus hoagii]|nr:hypothetical protein [Prescottella equi]
MQNALTQSSFFLRGSVVLAKSISFRSPRLWCVLVVAAGATVGCGSTGGDEARGTSGSSNEGAGAVAEACSGNWGENLASIDFLNRYLDDDYENASVSSDSAVPREKMREAFIYGAAGISPYIDRTPPGGQQRFLDQACASQMLLPPRTEEAMAKLGESVKQESADSQATDDVLNRMQSARYSASAVLYDAYYRCELIEKQPNLETLEVWDRSGVDHYTADELRYFENVRDSLCP